MKGWIRRLRGALGMGFTWGVAWFTAGMALLLVVGPDAADVPFPVGFGFLGFLAGASFSAVLGLLGRRSRFEEMSLLRFAGWGALGGLLMAAAFVPLAGLAGNVVSFGVVGTVFALAGGASAAGTLALARKASDGDDAAGFLGRGRDGRSG